jgi:hypothetical protein
VNKKGTDLRLKSQVRRVRNRYSGQDCAVGGIERRQHGKRGAGSRQGYTR